MQTFTPPDTVMGRALAARAIALVNESAPPTEIDQITEYDLTHPASVELPTAIRNAAKAALDRGETHYTTRPGIVELRSAIAEQTTASGIHVTSSDVVVTNGGVEALFIAMQSLITGQEKVFYAGLAPKSVVNMICFLGGEVAEICGEGERQFLPSPVEIIAAKPDILLLQTPSPITGAAYSQDEIQAIFDAACSTGTTIVIDQSASSNLGRHLKSQQLQTSGDLKLITIGSFSNEYSMGGWRIGWFTASGQHLKSMSGFKQTLSICTTAVSQYAALAALQECGDWLAEQRSHLVQCRTSILEMLNKAGITVLNTDSTNYLLLKITEFNNDDRLLRTALMETSGVQVDAGSDLHNLLGGYIRITVSSKNSIEAVQRMVNTLEGGI